MNASTPSSILTICTRFDKENPRRSTLQEFDGTPTIAIREGLAVVPPSHGQLNAGTVLWTNTWLTGLLGRDSHNPAAVVHMMSANIPDALASFANTRDHYIFEALPRIEYMGELSEMLIWDSYLGGGGDVEGTVRVFVDGVLDEAVYLNLQETEALRLLSDAAPENDGTGRNNLRRRTLSCFAVQNRVAAIQRRIEGITPMVEVRSWALTERMDKIVKLFRESRRVAGNRRLALLDVTRIPRYIEELRNAARDLEPVFDVPFVHAAKHAIQDFNTAADLYEANNSTAADKLLATSDNVFGFFTDIFPRLFGVRKMVSRIAKHGTGIVSDQGVRLELGREFSTIARLAARFDVDSVLRGQKIFVPTMDHSDRCRKLLQATNPWNEMLGQLRANMALL